jgi:hypothetical protein
VKIAARPLSHCLAALVLIAGPVAVLFRTERYAEAVEQFQAVGGCTGSVP